MTDDTELPGDEDNDVVEDAGVDAPPADDNVQVVATLFDGDTDSFTVARGSTLFDLSRKLHLPQPEKQVATDEDDEILTPDFVFTEDVTNICYVVNAKGGAA